MFANRSSFVVCVQRRDGKQCVAQVNVASCAVILNGTVVSSVPLRSKKRLVDGKG